MSKYNIIAEQFEEKWIAYVDHEDFSGTVVQGNSLPDVLNELSISVKCILDYRKEQLKTKP